MSIPVVYPIPPSSSIEFIRLPHSHDDGPDGPHDTPMEPAVASRTDRTGQRVYAIVKQDLLHLSGTSPSYVILVVLVGFE